MAHKSFDRIKESSTSTGLGAITLTGAVSGFKAFASVFTVADTCFYCIQHATDGTWEVGVGTYSAANQLTRTTVLSSSNANAAVNFAAGSKVVFLTDPANTAATRSLQRTLLGIDTLPTSPGVSLRATTMYDLFDRADQILQGSGAPTGQTWVTSGVGATDVAIVDGKLTSSANAYCALDYGATIGRIGGVFSFTSNGSTDIRSGTVLALIADNGNIVLATMLHLIVNADGWTLQKRVASGSFDIMAQGTHFLQVDTKYQIAMEIDIVAHTVTLFLPQNKPITVTDANITSGTINPRYGIIQINPDAAALKGFWHAFVMGPSLASTIAALGFAMQVSDVGMFLGTGLTLRRGFRYILPGAGWYRIATGGVLSTFMLAGRVRITAQDIYRGQAWELSVDALHNDTAPRIVQRFARMSVAPALTYIRLSTSSGVGEALDVYVGGAETVTLDVEFEGVMTPTSPPADNVLSAGATALPTGSNQFAYNEYGSSGAAQVAVATTPATNTTPYGFTTAAQADALVTLINEIRSILIANNLMKGSA